MEYRETKTKRITKMKAEFIFLVNTDELAQLQKVLIDEQWNQNVSSEIIFKCGDKAVTISVD